MPVQTPPHKISCKQCGWSTYLPGRGDLVTHFDLDSLVSSCPKCGSSDLKMRMLNPIEQILIEPWIKAGKVIKRRKR